MAHSFDEPDPIDSGTLRLLQAAVARLPAGVALVEAPSGRVLLRNEQASLIFKRDPAREAVGETGDYGPFVGYKADGRPYSAEEWPLARTVRTGEVVAAEDAEIVRADGTHGFIRMSSAPVRAADGRIVAGLMTFHDITDAKRTERDRAFLARAGVLLGESLEPDEILRRLARLAVPDVADWCVVHTLDGGRVHAVALEHRDAGRRAAALQMSARHPIDPGRPAGPARVLAGGPAELYPEVTDELLAEAAHDAEHLASAIRSAMVVPLKGRGAVLGALTFVSAESGRRYSAADLALAEDLGYRAGLAVENARLFEAERRARQRSDLLQRIAARLSTSLTPADAAQVVVSEARRAVGAAAAALWLLDEDSAALEFTASEGYPVGAEEGYERIALDARLPLADAVRGGEPVFLESPEARRQRYPALAGRSGPGFRAWAAVPLLIQGRVVGAAAFSFTEEREFTAEEERLLATLGLQAAQAITRARLFDAEHRARAAAEALQAETAVLYRLSAAANRAGSPGEIYEAALDAIREVLGVARASVLTFDEAGVMRFRAWRGLSPEYRSAVEGHSPWRRDTVDPRPIVVADVREDAELAAFGPVFEAEQIGALAFIPLVYGDRLLGKFMLYWAAPRALDARELEQAGAIAAQVASAVGRAEAQEALRDGHRRKDEFLAMLSHELRNPLAAARNAVHLLTSVPADEDTRRRWVEVIGRQTGNLVRIVDDLLDVSRITRGRIELRQEPADLRVVLQRALAATSDHLRAHRVEVRLPDAPLAVRGDPVRLEQVFVNLLANAAKYTPAGGTVELSAEAAEGDVAISVRDSGIGIEAGRLSRVFDLFDQGGRDLARTQGGLGVGLTIVRGLVELHGGRVEAHSAGQGRGSEFVVRLPAQPPAALATAMASAPSAPAPARRVLVVDDHVDSCEMLAALLESWGHSVDVVTEASAVVERVRAARPDFVLLDIGLPGTNGYELARALSADPATRASVLVAVTGYGQPADRARALASGFAHHLVKPVQPDALRALLAIQPRRAAAG